jgi:hypothetical protein
MSNIIILPVYSWILKTADEVIASDTLFSSLVDPIIDCAKQYPDIVFAGILDRVKHNVEYNQGNIIGQIRSIPDLAKRLKKINTDDEFFREVVELYPIFAENHIADIINDIGAVDSDWVFELVEYHKYNQDGDIVIDLYHE